MMKTATDTKLASIGRAIREGTYPVIARFPHYLDLQDGDDIIGLTDMEDEGGAHTIVFTDLPAGWAGRAAELTVGAEDILFDGRRFPRAAEMLYRDNLEYGGFAALPREEKKRRLRVFRDTLLEHAVPLSMAVVLDPARREYFNGTFAEALRARFLEGASACAAGAYTQATQLLQGVGYGLTPSGDDFLCGSLFAFHFAAACGMDAVDARALAAPIEADISQSAFMSRTFLRDAIAGRWPRRLRDAAESLGHDDGSCVSIRAAVVRALRHGASSGADLLSGFTHAALRCFAARSEAQQNGEG